MFKLRPYQLQAQLSIESSLEQHNAVLCTMPTGTGKTVVIASICKDVSPKRVLVLAHRGELIWQNAHSIEKHTGSVVGIEKGEHRLIPALAEDGFMLSVTQKYPNAISATIQTLASGGDGAGRYTKFAPTDIDYLIIDEAHRTITPSYLRIIRYFKQNPKLKIIGFTATPKRHDKQAMGQVYEHEAFHYDILDAVNDGWLVPPVMQKINVTGLTFANIRTVRGDFDRKQLAEQMELEKPLHEIVASACDIIGHDKSIAFCTSVAQSHRMCEIFNRYREHMAVHIDANTHHEDRKARFKMHRDYKAQVLCNVGIATEGYDDPGVKWILMCRPTKSATLYAQSLGRGLRPLAGIVDQYDTAEDRKFAIAESDKPCCHVIDYIGICGKHAIVSAVDVLGGTLSPATIKAANKRAGERKTPVTVTELLEDEKRRQQKLLKKREQSREQIVARCEYTLKTVSPFRTTAEIEMKKLHGDYTEPTIGQQEFLARHRINWVGMTRREAKLAVIGIVERYKKGYCRPEYKAILDKCGKNSNIGEEEARKEVGNIVRDKYEKMFAKG